MMSLGATVLGYTRRTIDNGDERDQAHSVPVMMLLRPTTK